MFTFNVHEELLRFQESKSGKDGDVYINYEIKLLDLGTREIDQKLDTLLEKIHNDASCLESEEDIDEVKSFIKYFDVLGVEQTIKFVDTIFSGFSSLMDGVRRDLEDRDCMNVQDIKMPLEVYAFLTHWLIETAETRWRKEMQEKEASAPKLTTGKFRAKPRAKANDYDEWRWEMHRVTGLTLLRTLMSMDLKRIIISAPDRATIVSMLLKTVGYILEEPENLKSADVTDSSFQIFALAVTEYDSLIEVRKIVLQNLMEEHLAEPMAEFLGLLVDAYNHSSLVEQVTIELKEIYLSDKDLKTAKPLSRFLIKLSERIPKETLKNMVYLKNQLDSESYTIRCAMIELLGNLIQYSIQSKDDTIAGSTIFQIKTFYDIMLERFRDVKAFVRVKLLQVLTKLATEGCIPVDRRMEVFQMATGRLYDASLSVRNNSIKLLSKLVETSPYMAFRQDNAKLSEKLFQSRLDQLEETFKARFPAEYDDFRSQNQEARANEGQNDAAKESEKPAADSHTGEETGEQELKGIRNLMRYYADGVKFCSLIKTTIGIMCELLASNKKPEIVESMNYFVTLHMYGLDCAVPGIKKMVHKVWDKEAPSVKETTGKAKVDPETMITGSVRDHLAKCYYDIYFQQYPSLGPQEDAEAAAQNLIQLTLTMNLAELTSFEQLMGLMINKGMIQPEVVDVVWSIFASKRKDMPANRRRAALQIISMMGKAKSELISSRLDVLLRVGLGDLVKDDLLLGKYACVALQQLSTSKGDKLSMTKRRQERWEVNHPLFARLSALILDSEEDVEWFGFAEQAINTIYGLSENPDVLCGEIIKKIASKIFNIPNPNNQDVDACAEALETGLKLTDDPEPTDNNIQKPEISNPISPPQTMPHSCFELSKLCFLVGHVAIKQIVHLELVEVEWKRRKAQEDITKTPRKTNSDDLDLVTGTAEDEFTEAIAIVREKELLFGENSLLALFGPVIVFICRNNTSFNDPILQAVSVLSLCKLMCISSEFCDANLQLLFTILEKSCQPIIRSNVVIGLGDMAVCFNSLIDQNISYVYNRLNDSDMTVKKNTLMVLTHLILNGMVKVKGQISEMAKCLEDSDTRISDLAKLFFTELSTKDNAVYNNLPDIISNLSSSAGAVEEPKFKRIMEFLFSFIRKAQHLDNLVEKLCHRFHNSKTDRHWRDISFCLSLIPYTTEKSVKKLVEGLPYYQDKLGEKEVFKHFMDILSKAKKLPKNDLKSFIEEFESKLVDLHGKCTDEAITTNAVNKAAVYSSAPVETTVEEESGEQEELNEAITSMKSLKLEEKQASKSSRARTRGRKPARRRSVFDETDEEDGHAKTSEDESDG